MLFKTKLSRKLFYIILFTSLIISCSEKSDKNLNQQQFEKLMSELMIVENMPISDSLKAVLVKNKLIENGITINEIKNHINDNNEDPLYWQQTYNRIKQIIKEKTN